MTGRLHRAAAALAGLLTLAAAATGCGIRPTSVPVDAGPAPSRVPCEVPDNAVAPQFEGVTVQVYLVCGAQLVKAQRSVRIPENKGAQDRLRFAQALLDELIAHPSGDEKDAGFTTEVKGPLTVTAARQNDPAGALRLSRNPEDLSALALSQVVCTYAENTPTAPGTQQVVLGGPGEDPARGYTCTSEMKSRPDSAATLGDIPRPSRT
uniref:Lipoprotein n=1 Tax=Streptomyces sp. NBC_00003 TaxID=2903608 RepID=A0AAU2V3Y8_9ACTN